MKEVSVVIIGSGPAGYTAALYAARANMKPVLFAGLQPGGQLTQTSEVENWPGEVQGIMGTELMEKLKAQAERFGTEVIEDVITEVDFSSYPFRVRSGSGKEVVAETVIISTGATAKWLGVPGEERLQAKGVSACATCDGFFFRGKEIVVVGGGDSAMEEATFLTKFASKVTIVHRSAEFRASKIMLERAQKNPKISFVMNAVIDEILGAERVEGIRLKDIMTGALTEHNVDGVFVAIGHKPNTELFASSIALDAKGYIVTEGKSTRTNIPGIFACGDVMDPTYRQAITAAGSGCAAALDAERWIAARE